MSIAELHERLVAEIRGNTNRDHRKLANNTYGRIEANVVVVKYHDTDIATIDPRAASYRTGGWFTHSTKERINRYLPQGWGLHSERSIWWLSSGGSISAWDFQKRSRFYDEIILRDVNGKAEVQIPMLDDPDADLRKAIGRYVKLYTDEKLTELVDQAVASGTNGDCLFCQMDHPGGGDHLLMHVAEGYVMVTLAVNAVKRAGYRPEIYVRMMGSDFPHSGFHEGKTIRRCILKMMKAGLLNKGFSLADALEEVNG